MNEELSCLVSIGYSDEKINNVLRKSLEVAAPDQHFCPEYRNEV